MTTALTLAYSPCPNDTFIFHALVSGRIPMEGLAFAPEVLEDVETLNRWALEGRFDVTKLSFHAFGHVSDQYVLLSSGAALGRGCGPLLVASAPLGGRALEELRIAIPGRYTTAAMLLKLFAPGCRHLEAMPFDQIMPAIAEGRVDCGVIIHESRFTYQEKGLFLIRDLGAWWEEESGLPIPLGGIAARRELGNEVIGRLDDAVRRSLLWARAHPGAAADYIRRHAQELEEQVTGAHIELYVNDFSVDLGAEGRRAVAAFLEKGKAVGLFGAVRRPFVVEP